MEEDLPRELLTSWNSWTPLHIASFGNNVDLALSKNSLDGVNKLDENGRPPLQIAVENQNVESIVALVEHGASFEHVTVNGLKGSKLFEHPHYFDLGVQLLPIVKFGMPQKFLSLAASHAGYTNQPGIVEAIVSSESFNSSVLNAYDSIGLTPIHYAVLGGSLESVRLMVDSGGDITTRLSRTDLSYPIHYACSRGDEDIFAFLCQHSFMQPSLLNSQDVCGRTPFHLAIYNHHWKFISSFSSLLESCDASVLDSNGHSVQGLLFQMRSSHLIPRDFLTTIPCLTQDEANWLLHSAISDVDQDLLCYALMQKANPNCFDFMQQSPLMHAAKLGCSEMCLLLLESGADQSIQDFSGCTALHHSSRNGHLEATRILLQFPGADSFLLSVDAFTPLDMAFRGGHLNVAGELLQAMKQISSNKILHWIKTLDLAVPFATNTILRQLVCHFPHNWIRKLLASEGIDENKGSSLSATATHRLVSYPMLRKYAPFPPLQKVYACDLKKSLNVRNKQRQHIEDAKKSKYKPFQRIFKTHKKLETPFMVQRYEHYYPIHEALNARNKDAFLFLLKASQDAGLVGDFLACKRFANVTVAQRLSEIFPEVIDECGIEHEVYQCLLKVFVENNEMSFPLSLLHHIVSDCFISKKIVSYSSVHQWPEWFLCKHVKEFSMSLGIFDYIRLDDIYQVTHLVQKVLESNLLNTEDVTLLLYCAVVNGVSSELFEALLGGNESVDLTRETLNHRWPLTEAIRRGYYDLARLLLMYGDVHSLCADNNDNPFKTKVMFSFHHISFAHEFDFALQLLKLFSNDWLSTFLFSHHSERLLYLCLSSVEASDLGNFLIDKYMRTFAQFTSEGKEPAVFSESKISVVISQTCQKSPWGKDNPSLALLGKFLKFCKAAKYDRHPILHQLCGRGQSDILRAFLYYDFLQSSNFVSNDNGFTPIYCAAAGGHIDVLKVIMFKFPSILENQNLTCFGSLFYLCYSNHIRNLRYSKSILEYYNLLPPFVTVSNLYEHDDSSVMADFLKLCILPCTNTAIDEESADRFVSLLLHTPNSSSVVSLLDESFITEVIEMGQQQSWFFDAHFFSSSKPQNFSDWLLKDSFDYNRNPSCDKFKLLVEKIFTWYPSFNPVSVVRKGYHEALEKSVVFLDDFAHSHTYYQTILEKWQLAVLEITRHGYGESALCILKTLNSIPIYCQAVFNLNKLLAVATTNHGDSSCVELLEYLLDFHPPTPLLISTVKCAVARGNIEALKALVAYDRSAIESDFTSILCAASQSGHSRIVNYFYENQYSTHLQEAFAYYHNSETTFWMTVFKNAVHSGQKELALSAVGKMPFSAMASLAVSVDVLYDVCWWGMDDVLSTLCVEESEVFFEGSDGYTPFQAALDSGHIGKMSEIDSFPKLIELSSTDIEALKQSVPETDLACRFSFGWLKAFASSKESVKECLLLSQFKVMFALPLKVLNNLPNVYFFFEGLASSNGYEIVSSYIHTWGKQASGVLYYMYKKHHSLNALELAVGGGNAQTVCAILQILYDAQVVSDFTNLSIFQKALLKDDVEVVELLKQFCDAQTVASLRKDKSGETILHIVSEYSRSPQCAHVILSMIKPHFAKLVGCLDSANMSPLQCAITLGRFYIAQELLNYVVHISNEEKKSLTKAFGWFSLLMDVNADTDFCGLEKHQDLLPISIINEFSMLPSLREKKVAEYYNSFKNLHSGIAESVMAASCGILPLHGLDYSSEFTGLNYSSKAPTWSRQKLINCVNSKELLQWCKKHQFKSVINIISYIISNDEIDLLNATVFRELFQVACSLGSLTFVEYVFDVQSILPSEILPNATFVEGFVTAVGLGQLEVAAYIMLNGSISQKLLKQELSSLCKPPLMVDLIFFTSAIDIFNILLNVVKQGESSRLLVSQAWLMHSWGKHQIELIERKIRQASLYTSQHLEIDLHKPLGVSLSVDVSCFPYIEAVSCPFSKLVVILSSSVSHFVSIWQYPPSFTLVDVPEDGIVNLSCDAYSSSPRYDTSSYNYSIVLAFDADIGLFEWPVTELNKSDLVPDAQSSDSALHLFTIPCQQLVELSCLYVCNKAELSIPIQLNLDSLSDDCDQLLLSTAVQCINDVLSTMKLHHYKHSLYTELGLLPAEFLNHYQHRLSLPLKFPLKKLVSKLSVEITLGANEVTAYQDSTGNLNVNIGIETSEDEGHICPSHTQITDTVGSSLVRSEISVLSNLLSLYLKTIPYPVAVCSYDKKSGISTDLTLLSDLSLKDILILQFFHQVKGFVEVLTGTLASCDKALSFGSIKIHFNTSNSCSYFNSSENTFNVSIFDVLLNRASNALALVMQDYNRQHATFDLSRPLAVTSYIDISESIGFFSSQKDGIVKMCNLEGDIIETAPLTCTKMDQHLYKASAKVNEIHVQNSPLTFHCRRANKRNNLMVIPLVVSHPGGGCLICTKPMIVMNSNYTSIRDKIPLLKLMPRNPRAITCNPTRNENVHFIGYVFGKSAGTKCVYTSGNVYFLVSNELEDCNFYCEITDFLTMAKGSVHQMSFVCDIGVTGSVVAVCSLCHCAMKIHSSNSSSFLLGIPLQH